MSGDRVGGILPQGVLVSTGLKGTTDALESAVSASEKEKTLDDEFESTGPADNGGVAVIALGNKISIR
jgi:hypothetical protein